jgi:hypothetical protein
MFAPARPFPTRAAEGRKKAASGCVLGAVGKCGGGAPRTLLGSNPEDSLVTAPELGARPHQPTHTMPKCRTWVGLLTH